MINITKRTLSNARTQLKRLTRVTHPTMMAARTAAMRFRLGLRRFSTTTQSPHSSSSSSSSSSSHSTWRDASSAARYSARWWFDYSVIMVVFAITGSSTAFVVRPLLSNGLGLQGSFKDGPMSYRVVSLVAMMPIYSALLVTVGTIFGRHTFFKRFAVKMWSRLLPASLKAKLLK